MNLTGTLKSAAWFFPKLPPLQLYLYMTMREICSVDKNRPAQSEEWPSTGVSKLILVAIPSNYHCNHY